MTKKKLSDLELAEQLFNAGAIKVVESLGDKINIKVALQQITCRDPYIRAEVARRFEKALTKMFPDEMRQKEFLYACIGTHAVAVMLGRIDCPVVTIAPNPLDTDRPFVRGKLGINEPFVLVDDLLKTGETLSRELTFLFSHGYKINTIIVFYDEEIGGQDRIREEYKDLSRRYFGREEEIAIVVLMPRKEILQHLVAAKLISLTAQNA